jgi:hypothetical protein
MKTFKTTDKTEVGNYPYGYLKTTAFFSLEFKAKKGFRTVFQTVNPKTGRLNKAKYSTYSPLILMTEDEKGFVSYIYGDFNGAEAINRDAKIVFDNFDFFTPEQIEYFYLHILTMLRVEAIAIVNYCGANFDNVKPILEPIIKICVEGLKTKTNLFDKIIIDLEKLNACKVPGFNPFRVVKHENILNEGMDNPIVEQISDHDKRNGETIETIQAGENVKVLLKNTIGYYNTI